jgi:hypothetical protein
VMVVGLRRDRWEGMASQRSSISLIMMMTRAVEVGIVASPSLDTRYKCGWGLLRTRWWVWSALNLVCDIGLIKSSPLWDGHLWILKVARLSSWEYAGLWVLFMGRFLWHISVGTRLMLHLTIDIHGIWKGEVSELYSRWP